MAFLAQPGYAVPARRALEVPVTTDPDEVAAGRGHMRAAHADRERVVEALKAAFAQGRLDTDELDDRVGRAFASRTYAELATLTADIPASQASASQASASQASASQASASQASASQASASQASAGQTVAGPAVAEPPGSPARTLATAARRAGLCILVALALVGLTALTHMEFFAILAYYGGILAVIAASGFLGYGVVDAWHERRSRDDPPAAGAQRTGSPAGPPDRTPG
jgi:Domain of unknown function (DUF1707)